MPYLPPEKTSVQVRKQQLELDLEHLTGSKLGKQYIKAIYLSPCLFNFYAEYNMGNDRLNESQARIKISKRNINSLRYADDTTPVAENEEALKSLLIKEESEKAGLKFNIQKTKIMASNPINFMANRWEKSGNSGRYYFLRLQNHCRWLLQQQN